ncbi:peptide ABC transporter permease [Clostridium sp. W14A]|uniref:ABC transporter permease n=1 Tax=Caproicibacter fermentans TaxID=2576756 RepID=A0A7G8T7M3_9FIRM|nr:ABC transporter permease [Caproicibacter fermentans]OCN01162.1 peptide ABC transporter permease [Clostridium sp. W14A]QNK39614.1 ABC transporter permease [Caproicibacter fermentans]
MKFYLKKLLSLLLTLLLVSVMAFAAFNLIPGDPAQLILGTQSTPEALAELHQKLGLDKSMPERYAGWLLGLLHGDMGTSLQYSRPVSELIGSRLPVTAALALMALLLIFTVSVPVGVFSAQKRGSPVGRLLDSVTMLNISMPGFFLGILFIWIFGLVLHFFSPGGYVGWRESPDGFLRYMIFPALAVALPNIAVASKFLRSALVEESGADYVRTAVSKGLSKHIVLYRHMLKNALIPFLTLSGMMVAEIFSGSILIEQVFGIPGVGRLLISSILSRDFPLLESLVVYLAFLVVLANFAADLLLQAADPRIRVKP